MNPNSQTERIHRLLVHWLDIQQALRRSQMRSESQSESRESAAEGPLPISGRAAGRSLPPWECRDKEVARLWEAITDPKNERALEEWLFQMGAGELELWAQQALLECRKRAGGKL
jgi:hypothetical protein